MGARQKLNQAYLNDALILAAVAGAATGSWAVFWLAAVFAAGSSLYGGNIRLHSGRKG
jgi:hypothetical protein